jgi:hypothetical protein
MMERRAYMSAMRIRNRNHVQHEIEMGHAKRCKQM